jgi:hypothetical protein
MHSSLVLRAVLTDGLCTNTAAAVANALDVAMAIFSILGRPNELYFHEIRAHTPGSKLSEPLGLVAGLPRQVFILA